MGNERLVVLMEYVRKLITLLEDEQDKEKLMERIERLLDECDDSDLACSPGFVSGLTRVLEGLECSTIDWEEVKRSATPLHVQGQTARSPGPDQ